jgi:trehalose-phosphatase
MSGLEYAIARAAAAPVLLVASDFDGTLSPIVNDPALAAPIEEATAALAAIADLPDTHVAVVSGRALEDLRTRVGMPTHVHLVGGHGAEIGSLPDQGLEPEQAARRASILTTLQALAGTAHGFVVEPKPRSVAFHFRNALPEDAEHALRQVRELAAGLDDVIVKEGKKVIELAVTAGDKGIAIRRLARSLAADSIIYIGDDVTDEDAFVVLGENDLGIKVGPGPTRATERIDDPAAVADLLERLLELRASHAG